MDDHDEYGRDWEDGGNPYYGTDINDPDFWDDAPIVSSYGWQQGVEDGLLVKCFENRWPTLSAGKPILATAGVVNAFSTAALIEIWNAYAKWRKDVEQTLPEEDRLFSTEMNGETIWVIEDGATFTMLFREEY